MKNQTVFRPIPVLTKRMFRTNRGRNLVAILAILLTTMMFATLFTLTQSMSRNLVEMTFRQTGYDAQASMRGLTEEQADLIADHPDVVDLGRSIVLGLAENQQLTGQSVEIRWANDTYAQHSYAAPTTGQMPQAADEIALDTSILDRLGIPHELGQTVTLEWRKDLNAEEVTTSTFTLCGFWEGNQSSYSSMAWVSRAYADEMTGGVISTDESQVLGLYMVQVNLASDQNIEAAMDRILADTGLTDLEYNVNLAYSPEMGAMAAQESMPMYLGMVLVFIAGYLIIYNIFQISVTADVQFYGKLKTLGTTTRQLKKLLYAFLPEKLVAEVLEVSHLCYTTFSRFLTGQCLEACILGTIFFVILSIGRFPYAPLIAVFIGFTALIPIFGAFIGCIVGAFLILTENPLRALIFIIIFLVVQQIEGNLIYPRVVGGSIGLPGIWTLVAVTVGGSLFGIIGMLVFIPLSSVFYKLLRREVNRRTHKFAEVKIQNEKKEEENDKETVEREQSSKD